MTLESAINGIREAHKKCCLTDSCKERGCGLNLAGLDRASLTMIHGSKYQDRKDSRHPHEGKLCDRVIFGKAGGDFLCTAEFKGGKKTRGISDAIDQIQGGLNLADSLLPGKDVSRWCALLVYRGGTHKLEIGVMRNTEVTYKGRKKLVRQVASGSRLLDCLDKPQHLDKSQQQSRRK